MKRIALTFAGIAGALALAAAVAAQPGPGAQGQRGCMNDGPRMGHRGPGGHGEHHCMQRPGGAGGDMMFRKLRALDLTAEQWQQVREIRTNTQKQVIRKRAELQVLRLEKRELMHSENPDRGDIEAKIREMGSLRTEIQILHANAMLAVREVLTAEQREKLLDPMWRPEPPADRPMHPRMRTNQN